MREQICKMNPEKRGHDACGIGAVVDRWGRPSRQTVEDALEIVEHLEHRAGKDASGQTGDGVGILLQICHPFFVAAAKEVGLDLAQAAPAPSSGRCRRSCSRQRRAARARESWPAWSIRPRAAAVGGRASAGSQARGTWQSASARINCSGPLPPATAAGAAPPAAAGRRGGGRLGQVQPHLLGRSDKEGMADLQEDPHTVPSLAGGVLPRPVLQVFHDLQGVLHRLAGRAAPSVHYRTDAAGVMAPFFWIHFAYLFSHNFTSHPSIS